MKTAEEIINTVENTEYILDGVPVWDALEIKEMILSARAEAIRECAEIAEVIGFDSFWEVNKDSILSLLEENI